MAECSTLKPTSSILVSVTVCQGRVAVCEGVKVLSLGTFACNERLGERCAGGRKKRILDLWHSWLFAT